MDSFDAKQPADFNITPGLVARLLAEQHPDLAGLRLGEAFEGWETIVMRLGDDLAVRLPRVAYAETALRKEMMLLPMLSPAWGFPTTTVERVGTPTAYYPMPWTVVRWLDGSKALEVPLVAEAAQEIGTAVRDIHVPPPVGTLDVDNDDQPRPEHTAKVTARIEALASRSREGGPPFDSRAARDVWEKGLATPDDDARCITHGDLHGGNVMSDDGRFVGIIDWGNMGVGEPAVDLGYLYLLLPAEAVERAFEAYGGLEAGTRARVHAVALSKTMQSALFPDSRVQAAGWRGLVSLGVSEG